MPRLFALLALIAMGACAPQPPPAPSGPWIGLNPTYFHPTQAELEALPQ